MNDYKDLIMEALYDGYDKVECTGESTFTCYIEPLDEIHIVTAKDVLTEEDELQGFELWGKNPANNHEWEIMYLPTEKGLEKWGELK